MASESGFRRAAKRVLAPGVFGDLDRIARVAAETAQGDAQVFLVGGMVRDVLRARRSSDIDLVAVGMSATEVGTLAQRVAEELSGSGVTPSELSTWRVELPHGRRVDLVAARREVYERPAALPAVAPGSLDDDLARRDFTINAMAVELGERWHAGQPVDVMDPHGGEGDLQRGLLRALHPRSFHDDPTRVLRGIELAVRLDLEFEESTLELGREALAGRVLDGLSPARWATAWRRAFTPLLENGALQSKRGLRLARVVGLLDALELAARYDAAMLARATRLGEQAAEECVDLGDPARLLARALAWTDEAAAACLVARWAPPEAAAQRWRSFGPRVEALVESLGTRARGADPPALSLLASLLEPFDADELHLLALDPDLAPAVERYRREVEPFRLAIDGHDLQARGHAPGPAFGVALRRTRAARLDGLIDESEELEYACRELEDMKR